MKDYWEKSKDFLKNTKDLQFISIANISGKIISGLFWFYVATLMVAEEYGQISYFIAIAVLATRISLIGSGQTITVYLAKKIPIHTPLIIITSILSTISAIIVYVIFQDIVISIYILLMTLYDVAIAILLGNQFFNKYSKYFITQKICATGFGLLLYQLMGTSGLILGIGLSFLILFPVIINSFKKSNVDFSLIKPRFGFMMNNYGLTIEKIFAGQVDKIIIVSILGFATVGNFHLGIQVLSIMMILPVVVFQYTLPRDAKGISNKQIKKITIIISIIFAILGIILAPIILPTIFPKYAEVVEIVQILSIYIIPNTINTTIISNYLGKEKSKIVLIGQSISISTYVLGILTLGTELGINGIAIAYVLSGIVQTIFYIIYKKKYEEN